ncbi:MAG: toprim domain-containing protein [Armatimonadota bacterium]
MDYIAFYNKYATLAASKPNQSGEVPFHCPCHDDRRPSASFNATTGLWYCHTCQIGGSPKEFLEQLGLPEDEIAEELRQLRAVVSEEVVHAWVERFWRTAAAQEYLKRRGLLEADLLRRLEIGFDGERLTIPVRDEEGVVVAVRRLAVDGRKPKALNLGGTDTHIWPVQVLQAAREAGAPVYLCEGETDCLSALCQGLYAVTGTGGAGTFKDEWCPLFRGLPVVVAYDGDEAGRRGAERAAAKLVEYAGSVRLADVPDGEDVNSLHVQGVRLDLLPTRPVEPPDAESMLASLPEDLKDKELEAWTDRFLRMLLKKSSVGRERLLREAAKRLGIRVQVLRTRLEQLAGQQAAPEIPVALREPCRLDASLSQDYHDGVFWYGMWLPTTTGEWTFRLVTSERELKEVDKEALKPPRLVRWSVDAATPYNVFAWLRGDTEPVDSAELYRELRGVFTQFMWYPDEYVYDVLALWVMMSYVYMVFDAVPYLALTGTKEAGKTRTLELLAALAFNAMKVSSISAASLYRTIELTRSVVLFDEGDVIAITQRKQEGVDDRLAAILDGYKWQGHVVRCDREGVEIRLFSTYAPKAFASMFGLPDTVVSRAIVVNNMRHPVNVKLGTLVFAREERRFQVLCNKLYCWGLENALKIAGVREQVDEDMLGVRDREFELWHPLYCIALVAGCDATNNITSWAEANLNAKHATEQETSLTVALIQACWQLLDEEPTMPGGWYARDRIRVVVANIMEKSSDEISPERIAHELVRTGIIGRGKEWRIQFGIQPHRGKRGYRLERRRILEAAARFDVDLNIEAGDTGT